MSDFIFIKKNRICTQGGGYKTYYKNYWGVCKIKWLYAKRWNDSGKKEEKRSRKRNLN